MLTREERRAQRMLNAIAGIGLTTQEEELVENYLLGKIELAELSKLTVRNLEHSKDEAQEACRAICKSLQDRDHPEDFYRFFQVLYALGKTSCHVAMGDYKYAAEATDIEKEKLIAVYARSCQMKRYYQPSVYLYQISRFAEKSSKVVWKAIECCEGESPISDLLLYTVYFWLTYPDEVLGDYVTSLAAPKQADKKRMGLYEKILTESVSCVFQEPKPFMTREWFENVEQELRNGKLSEATLEQVRDSALDEDRLALYGSCAHINYPLSPILHEVVKLFMAANHGMTLYQIHDIRTFRKDFEKNTGHYDVIFGIPADALIVWGADKKSRDCALDGKDVMNLLTIQFRKNRELYLKIWKNMDLDASILMLDAVKREDAALYHKLVGNSMDNQREHIMAELLKNFDRAEEAAAYLRGEIPLEDLYPIADSMTETGFGGREEWKELEKYLEKYDDRDFQNRAIALFATSGKKYFFNQPLYLIREKKQKQVDILLGMFQSMEESGLDILHQVEAVSFLVDSFWADEDKNAIVEVVTPIFLRYLEERREETTKAFLTAGAYGRLFGLRLLISQADEYQAEILGFAQDGSKQVKEELGSFLKEKSQWREQVTVLLSSKKAAERELAIRVLAHWNQPEDKETLRALYEREKNAKIKTLLEEVLKK